MTESSLTTAREREVFKSIVRDFLANNLSTAPREQLHDIEAALFRWRPVADHRRADRPLYGANGAGHLFGGGA